MFVVNRMRNRQARQGACLARAAKTNMPADIIAQVARRGGGRNSGMGLARWTMMAGCVGALLSLAAASAQPRIGPGSGGGSPPAQPAQPAAGIVRGTNPELTVQALKSVGYSDVEFVEVNDARQVQAKVNGVTIRVYHYGCENNVCSSVAFYTSFGKQQQIDANYINAWNREKRFAKLYVESNGALSFDMDVHFTGGVSQEYLASSARLFGTLLKVLFEFKPAN